MARIFLVLSLLLASFSAHAASSEDVKEVEGFMTGVSKTSHPALCVEQCETEKATFQSVFISDGVKYTMFIVPAAAWPEMDGSAPGFLSVWERQNGTVGQSSLSTYTDYGLNRSVEFGMGPGSGTFEILQRIRTATGTITWSDGAAFRSYWQAKYDTAITRALAYYRTP